MGSSKGRAGIRKEGEGPQGPRSAFWGGGSGGALKRDGLWGPGGGGQGRCSTREDEGGRTRPSGRPCGRGSIGRKPGREQQGGRRVLLRADFARAASPQGRYFAPPFPSTAPRRGPSARRPLRDARASLPASRPLASRSPPSRPNLGRRALTSQTDTLA